MSAKELTSDYRSNQMAADQKYRGQHLAVTGDVESVVGEVGVTSFVSLSGGIQCQVKDKYQTDAMELRRGDRVELLGLCEGNTSTAIMMSDCAIIRQAR